MSEAAPRIITADSGMERGEEPCGMEREFARLDKRSADQAAPIYRIALLIEYLGAGFHGSQAQIKNIRTVQSVLEAAVTTWLRLKEPARLVFSGRTDSGVHARGQVAHFNLPSDYSSPPLDMNAFCWGLNGILPSDISVRVAAPVDSAFHARFSAVERKYIYRILNHKQRSPLLKDTHCFIRHPLEIESMQESIACLPGSHDFIAFKSTNSDHMTTICAVSSAQLLHLGEGELEFSITANHFVYNMVRIIAGTMIEIGLKKRAASSLELALRKRERQLAGPTAPATGLCLVSVKYPTSYTDIFADVKVREITNEDLQCKSYSIT